MNSRVSIRRQQISRHQVETIRAIIIAGAESGDRLDFQTTYGGVESTGKR